MFDLLIQHIQEKVQLTTEEAVRLEDYFTVKKLRRKQYLLQEGDVCKHMAFVAKGVLKSYVIDEKGVENINFIGWEGWWMADSYSFFTGEKGVLNIDALEEVELLLISKEDYDRIVIDIPVMSNYFRILYERSLANKDRRILSNIAYNAEEKYAQIITCYPDLVNRIPQHLLASYLGLTPETVSRIKKKMK
ncbi:Crp/Fnr family transcriptional regulator [Myroides odoratimimus]|uniref:Crp/Fnr family transcriptional regulator n=2 Tax=Myroides odoratimimus TaxID=76832 RepID=UPI00103A6752|nr:Crp/Fnr family transcriptional regulator [Myroides odoratimimus]MCA4793055.1 Crp/Fnr family transcriptional regulator [Myroides odoratimimus]MCA4806811.1 Crp/Fnr family transcriptional regulator [Myroides odoratimimus]MCA4820316.1 Crp/Fnr family transcriptional regulator [Myroides odoratimimus]MCS7474506.1 Crp/Fnr family transcriptional regulator [Myroides odoratimimus]MDM1059542.1 Crp/Fnr family transcriptional regulator [Myroides odoratimimus]